MQPSDNQNNLPEAPSAPQATSPSAQPQQLQPASTSTNGLAIAGLITAFLLPLLGLILSIIGLSQAKKRNQNGRGLAIAGIVLSIIFMIFQLLFFFSIVAGVQEAAKQADTTKNNLNTINTDRADSQVTDKETKVGETAVIDNVHMTLTNPKYVTSLSEYDEAKTGYTYVTADVVIENKSNQTKPYNVFDFRIQTAGGQVLDSGFATLANPLNSGDLVSGGKVSGQIVFEIPVTTGSEYIIWKPSFLDSTRAVVQIR